MKKIYLLTSLALFTLCANAQVIFNVESPASIGGEYPFGDIDIATWPLTPDMTIPSNYIQGILEVVADPGGDTLSCNPLSADLTGKIDISINENDEKINFIIIDNGLGFGIFEDNIKNILNPYFTTKKKGTGLGLSIVNKIINDHNGKINFVSLDDGAKIEIMFIK